MAKKVSALFRDSFKTGPFFVLQGNEDQHKILDELKFGQV